MPPEQPFPLAQRIRGLAAFLASGDAVRVRVERDGEEIELIGRTTRLQTGARASEGSTGQAAAPRLDAIKAELVGIFRFSRPAPVEGDAFEGDRELGYIEALGIRTPVHSVGGGRIALVAAGDGSAVEYGQPLFLLDRG